METALRASTRKVAWKASSASRVVVAHHHPSGGLEPSASDISITAQLEAASAVVGIGLLDHIIFNRSGYFSFLEGGRL
jgi:DNA repair protein RadC